jgi:hypothetical protein
MVWRAGELVLKWLRIWDRRAVEEAEEALMVVARVAARAAAEVREGIWSSSVVALEEEDDDDEDEQLKEGEQEGVERAEEEEASLKNCLSDPRPKRQTQGGSRISSRRALQASTCKDRLEAGN